MMHNNNPALKELVKAKKRQKALEYWKLLFNLRLTLHKGTSAINLGLRKIKVLHD